MYGIPLNNQENCLKMKIKKEEFWACNCQGNSTVTCVIPEKLSIISKNSERLFKILSRLSHSNRFLVPRNPNRNINSTVPIWKMTSTVQEKLELV